MNSLSCFVDATTHSDLSHSNSPVHSKGNESLYSTRSSALSALTPGVLLDLERVLAIKETDYKKVHFHSFTPIPLNYVVSNPVDESTLRRPDPLFPLALHRHNSSLIKTAQEKVQNSPTLQEAAAKNTVKMKHNKNAIKVDDQKDAQCTRSKKTRSKGWSSTLCIPHPKMFNVPSARTLSFIELFIRQRSKGSHHNDLDGNVHFDKISVTESNEKTVLLSSRALKKGTHEWTIEILKSDVDLQEIGVIGTSDTEKIPVSDSGARDTKPFKARSVYGCEMSTERSFYGSWNENGKQRCHRDLTPYHTGGWTVGSIITVRMNLDKRRIKYLFNGKAVRYTMSIEPKKAFYPIICFSGNCKYCLH